MSLIVKAVTRVTIGIIFLFGGYIVAHGHLTPGGGFAGGVIIALCYILYVLAYGKVEAEELANKKEAEVVESLGALMFLTLALLGFAAGFFFANFLPKGSPGSIFSAGIIPLCNIAIMFKVGAGLFAAFIVLVVFRVRARKEEE
ncbi:MAG: MnhB domain-containing protein [Candidatus Margulisiibacteriota bacterium]